MRFHGSGRRHARPDSSVRRMARRVALIGGPNVQRRLELYLLTTLHRSVALGQPRR